MDDLQIDVRLSSQRASSQRPPQPSSTITILAALVNRIFGSQWSCSTKPGPVQRSATSPRSSASRLSFLKDQVAPLEGEAELRIGDRGVATAYRILECSLLRSERFIAKLLGRTQLYDH